MSKVLVLSAVLVIGWAGIANADLMGVNMGADYHALGANDWAGVLPQQNWNNAGGSSGSLSNLVDAQGIATTASITWSAYTTWHVENGSATGDAKLMGGYLDPVWGDWEAVVTISDIPYWQYQVFVYVGGNNTGARGRVTDGTLSYGFTNAANNPGGDGFQYSDYLRTATLDTVGFPDANYAEFSETSSSVTIRVNRLGISGSEATGIFGIQIMTGVGPEPTTMALLGLGGLALTRRKR